jgi:hypothetical protein
MYRIAFSREPTEGEMRQNVAFLQKRAEGAGGGDGAARSALGDLAHVLLNLNEFVYVK